MTVSREASSGSETYDGRTVISCDDMLSALERLCDSADAEYVICDTAAGIDIPLMLAGGFTDMAIVASSHQPSSMRAAENTAVSLENAGIRWIRMIISAFELSGAYNEKRAGLIDIIDNAHVRIIGVVPHDRSLMLAHEHGTAADRNAPSSQAFLNIAERLEGKQVKLFRKVKGIAKRKIY
jgi:septum site-determining protein MinD